MSSDGRPSPDDEVTLAELAALRAGALSADEEARLRMRMAGDPEVEDKLWALDNVHRLFEKPPEPTELPAEMPYDVAARLQSRLADQALRRDGQTCSEDVLEDNADHEPTAKPGGNPRPLRQPPRGGRRHP